VKKSHNVLLKDFRLS